MTANRDLSAHILQECVKEVHSALNEVGRIKTGLDSLSGRCALTENKLAKSIAAIVNLHVARIQPPQRSLNRLAATFQISSDYFREVTRTTDIAGRLPNAVYTLPPRLVQAIVGLADVTDATREALVAECKKFFLASREYEESKEVFVNGVGDKVTTITLDCGRLYSEGNNREGQCGIGSEDEVTGPRLIRLPPVLEVWHRRASWFANTTWGLYAWGWNYDDRLGVGNDDERVRQPCRVLIDGNVLNVSLIPCVSFFRTATGWFVCGDNSYGQFGLGHTDQVTTPTRIPGSEGVTRWGSDLGVSFGFSDAGLLACGDNAEGQCGVGSTERHIATLTPVILPDDVKGRVDRVVLDEWTSFFITGRRFFACGANLQGQLGLGSDEETIPTPTELLIPVDDIVCSRGLTVIRSGDTLLACGDNRHREISADDTLQFATPTPLDLPGPVVKVVINWDRISMQLTDGAWVGKGVHRGNPFIPVPEADLINGEFLPGWTPVSDDYVEKLNAREAADDAMILPGPE